MAKIDIPDRVDSFVVMPATPIQVQAALGRLALATRNMELALHHANRLINEHPNDPKGFELRAMVKFEGNDPEAGREDVNRAVALDSQDAGMHVMAAQFELTERMQNFASLDEALSPEEARRVADRVIRALELRSIEPRAFEMLAISLMNVRELTTTDEGLLEVMERFMPKSGLPALVRSVSAYRQSGYHQARELHALACSPERELPASLRTAAKSMGEHWLFDKLKDAFQDAENTTEFDAAYSELETAMATPENSSNLTSTLRRMNDQVVKWRKHLPEGAPHRKANTPTLEDYWQSILDDPQSSQEERDNAQRALKRLIR